MYTYRTEARWSGCKRRRTTQMTQPKWSYPERKLGGRCQLRTLSLILLRVPLVQKVNLTQRIAPSGWFLRERKWIDPKKRLSTEWRNGGSSLSLGQASRVSRAVSLSPADLDVRRWRRVVADVSVGRLQGSYAWCPQGHNTGFPVIIRKWSSSQDHL